MFSTDSFWLTIGLLGQALFSARFFVQWLASERARASIVPMAFWYFSVLGGVVLLGYAIHRADPVFIIGQATGLVIYFRNLHLLKRPAGAATGDTVPGGHSTG